MRGRVSSSLHLKACRRIRQKMQCHQVSIRLARHRSTRLNSRPSWLSSALGDAWPADTLATENIEAGGDDDRCAGERIAVRAVAEHGVAERHDPYQLAIDEPGQY